MTDTALTERILAALASVPEPCSIAFRKPISIVEMGLVEHIKVTGCHAEITLCLTDTACVHFTGMQQYIRDVLLQLTDISSVDVRQTLDQLWTPDRRHVA